MEEYRRNNKKSEENEKKWWNLVRKWNGEGLSWGQGSRGESKCDWERESEMRGRNKERGRRRAAARWLSPFGYPKFGDKLSC